MIFAKNLIIVIGGVLVFKGIEQYIPKTIMASYAWALIVAGTLIIAYNEKIVGVFQK